MRFIFGIPIVRVTQLRPWVLVGQIALIVTADPVFVDPRNMFRIGLFRKASFAFGIRNFLVGAWPEQIGRFDPKFNKIAVT